MARNKSANKKSYRKKSQEKMAEELPKIYEEDMESKTETGKKISPWIFILGLLIIVLGFLFYRNKDLLLAGMVNGKPIFTSELNGRLKERYGSQTLEEIINERLVYEAAQQKNILVTDKEIDNKIKEVEKSMAGQGKLSDILKQQGLTEEEFRKQITLRLLVDKLLAGQVKVSDKEIDDYISKNEELLTSVSATDAASQKKYAKDTLTQQKMSEAFEKWFNELKTKAKIEKYL